MRLRRKTPWLMAFVLILLLFLSAVPAMAQTPCDSQAGRLADLYSREQLKRFVDCAAAHIEAVGLEQATLDFEGSAWYDEPVYLFAGGEGGQLSRIFFITGSGLPAGTDMAGLEDSDGFAITAEMERIATDFGEGYVYYRFQNRVTGEEEPKVTFVKGIELDGEPAVIGAGYYPTDTHDTCSPEVVRASLVYTERDLERFVTCAAHHLRQNGLQALHDFSSDPRWVSGPTYLFFHDLETTVSLASGGQPQLVGTVRDAAAYPAGRVPVIPEMQRILASHDDGFVYYTFRNPASDEEGRKIAYVRRVLLDGRAYLLASGLYLPADECRALPLARDINTRVELERYVRCGAQLIAERGEQSFDLLLNHPQWIGGATYVFVTDELCLQVVYPLGYRRAESDESRCDLEDEEGNLVNQDILDASRSEAGEGWVRYLWFNPASETVEAKHSFVIGGTLDGAHISIGAGLYESQIQE